MFLGMLGFWLVASLVPEPDIESLATSGNTGVALQAPDKMTLAELQLELADAAGESSGPAAGTRAELVSRVEEARGSGSSAAASASSSKLMLTGLIACIGISLHNLPEGLIVYTQTLSGVCSEPWAGWAPEALAGFMQGCMGRGVAITTAMALHNIPEGMAVAAPVLAATGSKWEALKWCFLSSIVEPVGAIVMGVSFQDSITEETQSVLEAVVGGIMVMLCLMELMPTAAEYAGARAAAVSNLVGQAAIFFGLSFFH
jgi:ZIP family zinc transporter